MPPTLPTQTVAPLDLIMYRDARAFLTAGRPRVVQGVYQRNAAEGGQTVNVIVTDQAAMGITPGTVATAKGGPKSHQHTRQNLMVMLCAMGPDETPNSGTGVGSLGGIAVLEVGQLLLVPGRVAGRPDAVSRQLRIAGDIRNVGGLWTAEVA